MRICRLKKMNIKVLVSGDSKLVKYQNKELQRADMEIMGMRRGNVYDSRSVLVLKL